MWSKAIVLAALIWVLPSEGGKEGQVLCPVRVEGEKIILEWVDVCPWPYNTNGRK